jgi:hypothetical protein
MPSRPLSGWAADCSMLFARYHLAEKAPFLLTRAVCVFRWHADAQSFKKFGSNLC